MIKVLAAISVAVQGLCNQSSPDLYVYCIQNPPAYELKWNQLIQVSFAGFAFTQADCSEIYDYKMYDVTSGSLVEPGSFAFMISAELMQIDTH